jgi:alpha-beta hydrolase superfamily lysophospholipase
MQETKTKRPGLYLKWIGWVLAVQLVFANISASIYAYRFTHFYTEPVRKTPSRNFFSKTWKLFTGPRFYKLIQESEPSFPYKNITLLTNSGDSIDCWYSSVDSARACVLLLHGITTNKSFMEDEALQFRSLGYNVLLIDFRGHGRSSGHTTTTGIREIEEVQKAFEFAKAEGNDKIFLYGVSLGAVVALNATAKEKIHPDAIIADMPFDNLHNHLKSRARDVGFPSQPFAFLVTFWIGAEHGFNAFDHDAVDYAEKIHCPVLLQWGERDRFVNRKAITKIFEHLATTNKHLAIYPEADHESLLRNDPVLWNREVGNFLKEIN